MTATSLDAGCPKSRASTHELGRLKLPTDEVSHAGPTNRNPGLGWSNSDRAVHGESVPGPWLMLPPKPSHEMVARSTTVTLVGGRRMSMQPAHDQSPHSEVEFAMKLRGVRHDDVAGLQIFNHQALIPFSQVQRHKKAYTCIKAVLIRLSWLRHRPALSSHSAIPASLRSWKDPYG
jgi:hypothetical protein